MPNGPEPRCRAAHSISIGEEGTHLGTQLAMQKAAVDDERARQGVLMRRSHCKLSYEGMLAMSDMWEKNDFRGQALAAPRKVASTAPRVPGDMEQLLLADCACNANSRRCCHGPDVF